MPVVARFVAPASGSADLTVGLCADPVRAWLSRAGHLPVRNAYRTALAAWIGSGRTTILLVVVLPFTVSLTK